MGKLGIIPSEYIWSVEHWCNKRIQKQNAFPNDVFTKDWGTSSCTAHLYSFKQIFAKFGRNVLSDLDCSDLDNGVEWVN